MKNFFRNIAITFEDFIEQLKVTEKKKIINAALISILIIAIIICTGLIIKERQKPVYSLDKTINGYITEYTSFNYYDAYSYTIIGNNGVDNYIENNYLKELKNGQMRSEEAVKAANSLTLGYANLFFNKASVDGYNDCDKLFDWYFSNAIQTLNNTELKDYTTKKVILTSFKQVLTEYKTITDDKLKNEYLGYILKAKETGVKDFTNDEVELYINNKSDKSINTFNNAKLNHKKIKAVKRYDYDIVINSKTERTMSVYVIKVGQKWYIDNTALL